MHTPLVLVSGGLGSGKTTLLKSMAAMNPDCRFGIIVNEFGEIGIDGDLLRPHVPAVMEIKNGCICCSTQDQFIPTVRKILGQFEVDVLLVEMSGAGDPGPVIQQLSILAPFVELRCHLVLVDGTANVALATDDIILRTALTLADRVAINKGDIAPSSAIEEWKAFLSSLGVGSEVLEPAKHFSVGELLYDAGASAVQQAPRAPALNRRHEHRFKTVHLTVTSMSTDAFVRFIESLGNRINRIKGIIELDGLWTEVHVVRGVMSSHPYLGDAPLTGRVVFISEAASRRELEGLILQYTTGLEAVVS